MPIWPVERLFKFLAVYVIPLPFSVRRSGGERRIEQHRKRHRSDTLWSVPTPTVCVLGIYF